VHPLRARRRQTQRLPGLRRTPARTHKTLRRGTRRLLSPAEARGPTNIAYALINFRDLASYERYRDNLMKDPDAIANVAAADASGCILIEDRSFLRKV
jgi:NIPSNAP